MPLYYSPGAWFSKAEHLWQWHYIKCFDLILIVSSCWQKTMPCTLILKVYSNLEKLTFRAGLMVQHEFYSIETILGKEKLSIWVDVLVFKFSYTPCVNDINLELNIKTSRSLYDGKIFKHPFWTSYFHLLFSFKGTITDYSRISKIKEVFLTCLACRTPNFTLPSFSKGIYSSLKLSSKLQVTSTLTSSVSLNSVQ